MQQLYADRLCYFSADFGKKWINVSFKRYFTQTDVTLMSACETECQNVAFLYKKIDRGSKEITFLIMTYDIVSFGVSIKAVWKE